MPKKPSQWQKPSQPQALLEALSSSPGYLFSQVSRLLRQRIEAALAPLELSLYEYVTLRLIALDAPLSQGMLGETYSIDRTTMVALVDRLEERELMTRQRDAADRRRYTLALTARGRKLLARAQRLAQHEQKIFLNPLPDPDWQKLRQSIWLLINENSR